MTFFRRRERKLLRAGRLPASSRCTKHGSNYKNNSFQRLPISPKTPKTLKGAVLCLSATTAPCCVLSRSGADRTVPENTGGVFAERRPGLARRATSFLCATRKEAPIPPHSSAALRGHTCAGVLAGCAVTHCAPAALRSNNHGESVDEAGVSCGTPPPRKHPPQAQPEGGGSPGHRCARPRVRRRKRHALASQTERSAGVADSRVAFSFGYFWRSKEQVPRPPGRDPPAPSAKRTVTTRPCMGSSPMSLWIDTHCHLDAPEFAHDADAVRAQARRRRAASRPPSRAGRTCRSRAQPGPPPW